MMGYYFSFLVTHLLNFLLSLRRLLITAKVTIDLSQILLIILCVGISIWLCSFISPVIFKTVAFILLFGSLLVLTGIAGKRDIIWFQGLVKTASKP
jgi:hypothetical protein